MQKWPNVPALFGWLRLDRRGHWYLRGVRVERSVLEAFIGRNYESDDKGRWYFQNGPQRGYVALEYTPWVLRAEPDGALKTHTDVPVSELSGAFVDEQGRLLLSFERGVGLLNDADLGWAVERLRLPGGEQSDDVTIAAALERLQAGDPAELALVYNDRRAPVAPVRSDEVPRRFGFVPEPAPDQ
jgi:hypothetical protein